MSAIRATGGKTESALSKALFRRGLRYLRNSRSLPGVPDIVFRGAQVAVFVDGDYWHGRTIRENGLAAGYSHFTADQQPYWIGKLQRNIARDAHVNQQLRKLGWFVLRLWESDVAKNLEYHADEIEAIVRSRKSKSRLSLRKS